MFYFFKHLSCALFLLMKFYACSGPVYLSVSTQFSIKSTGYLMRMLTMGQVLRILQIST